jgi:undecaprenyl-diphosphatase
MTDQIVHADQPTDDPKPVADVRLREQVDGLDRAVYGAVAAAPTPSLDRAFEKLSLSANYSRLWMAVAAGMALTGPRGRQAALEGLAGIAATSAVVNAVAKPMGGRRRPDRAKFRVPIERQVNMPGSTSFPSGHSGSAFAFASSVSRSWPVTSGPVHVLATLVAYSRVHSGVHYPGDVIAGSLIGSIVGPVAARLVRRGRDVYAARKRGSR